MKISLTNLLPLGILIVSGVAPLAASETVPMASNRSVTAPAVAVSGSVAPTARDQQVFAPAGEGAPVARTQPVFAPASEGEIAPIAADCECEHQAPGGPGQSSGTFEPSSDVGLELGFNTSRDQAVLSFHSITLGASGNEIYRVEESSDLGSDASSWSTVWEGSAAEVDAEGGISLAMSLKSAAGFFRVVVLTSE